MAGHILGIDLGAYSVKVVVAQGGFRQPTVLDVAERRVPPGDEPLLVRSARTAGELLRELKLEGTPVVAVPGEKLFIHVLEFGFTNLKRADLEKAVGSELEDLLPVDMEEMVYAFDPIPSDLRPPAAPPMAPMPAADEDPTFVQAQPRGDGPAAGRAAAPAQGMRVLAVAARKDDARTVLTTLAAHGAEPRSLIAAPASYARLAERLAKLGGTDAPVAVVDIGHVRTDVCVIVNGKAVFFRTIARGGHHVTEAISRAWHMPYEQAEAAKHSDGFVGSTAEPVTSEAWKRIHDVVVTEAGPLARDLKQTFAACRAKTGAAVARVELVGGGARLRGLPNFLAEKTGLPCTGIDPQETEAIFGSAVTARGLAADAACLAAGVAFEGASGRAHFDLRQGELAYKADLSFLRAKAGYLAAVGLVVMAFAAINAYFALNTLRKAERTLDKRLAAESQAALGSSLSADQVIKRVGSGDGDGDGDDSPIPKMTAWDILRDISDRLPPGKEVKLDVTSIDIKPGKIQMQVTTAATESKDAVQGAAEIIKALKTQPCFEDVQRGDIASGQNETKTFPVTITSTCD
jgi:general secretion pathway protein L